MKKSLILGAVALTTILAGCGPTATTTTTTTGTGTTVTTTTSVSSMPAVVSGAVVASTETITTPTTTTTTTVVSGAVVSSMAAMSDMSVASVAPVAVSSTSMMSLQTSMDIINNTKFTETDCEKIRAFMACFVKGVTGDNQVIVADSAAQQLKQMVADSSRATKCTSDYQMMKSSPQLSQIEAQVKCTLQ